MTSEELVDSLKREELADNLQLEGDARHLFLLRLKGAQVSWKAMNATQWTVSEWVPDKQVQGERGKGEWGGDHAGG